MCVFFILIQIESNQLFFLHINFIVIGLNINYKKITQCLSNRMIKSKKKRFIYSVIMTWCKFPPIKTSRFTYSKQIDLSKQTVWLVFYWNGMNTANSHKFWIMSTSTANVFIIIQRAHWWIWYVSIMFFISIHWMLSWATLNIACILEWFPMSVYSRASVITPYFKLQFNWGFRALSECFFFVCFNCWHRNRFYHCY